MHWLDAFELRRHPWGPFLEVGGLSRFGRISYKSAKATRQVQKDHLTKAVVRFVPNGVNIPLSVTDTRRAQIKSELGFNCNDLVIGTIGRLDANKNQAMLLRACAPLKDSPTVRLAIIGDGPTKVNLMAHAKALGIESRVSFLGSMPEAARYLPAMEVACLTSYTEGMPNLIMEASAAGLPVISTDCGDTSELIENGVTGYLVSTDDHTTMSEYLDLLLKNCELRSRMGQAGQEKMRREFSVETMIKRMTQVYEDALDGKILQEAQHLSKPASCN